MLKRDLIAFANCARSIRTRCCLDIILTGAPGYRWISIALGWPGGPSEDLVLDLCDMSYRLVFSKLTKRVQREILAN